MASELDRTVGELREPDDLKSRFVSMVSRELRAPLTSIRGFVEELEDEAGTLSDESGRVCLRPEEVRLAALLGELARELAPSARSRDVALHVDVARRPGGARRSQATAAGVREPRVQCDQVQSARGDRRDPRLRRLGQLEIDSTVGEGATFRIVLPADGPPPDDIDPTGDPQAEGGGA